MTTMRQIVAAAAMIATMTTAHAGEFNDRMDRLNYDWDQIYMRNAIIAGQRSGGTEALINEMRAARGAPPCAYGGIFYELFSGLAGKPPCP